MLALHRCGRQAEALALYAETRRLLVEELGIEPSAELRSLHSRILAAEVPASALASASVESRTVPAQLPADVYAFTGRAEELASLDRLLAERDTGPGAEPSSLVISAVSGTAGVGKTALAVHWAHRRRAAFPDGQLYVNLRGYDPDRPVPAADALAMFLAALGTASHEIPGGLHDRANCFRTLVSGRRLLVLLDNAATADQVRPLLPGSPSCLVIVTSRNSLAGLVARDGARRLDLGLLPLPDAVALLRTLIGTRVDTAPVAAAALAGHCARLPLALRLAAERAVAMPAAPLGDLAHELADERRRLDHLDAGGDSRATIRGVFSWSTRHLPPAALRAFRLLGLHPGPDFDAYAVAAVTRLSPERADAALRVLARAHLIQPASPGRYALHDLLRAYAASLAESMEPAAERRAALEQLFNYYLAAGAAAMDTLFPAERHRRPAAPGKVTVVPPVADPRAARAWLDAERPVLVAVAGRAAGAGLGTHAIRLSAILYRYLDTCGHYTEAMAVHTEAYRAATASGDLAGQAAALTGLGTVHWRHGDHDRATSRHQQALALFRRVGDRDGEARALTNISIVDWRQGRYQDAADRHRQAVTVFSQAGDDFGAARALSNLGIVLNRQGRYREAADCYQRALDLFRRLGDQLGQAYALGSAGVVCSRQGDQDLAAQDQAAQYLEQSLALFRQLGDRGGQASALSDLGTVRRRQGGYDEAESLQRQALALFCDMGDRSSEAEVRNTLGETLAARGQPGQAEAEHEGALVLAEQAGDQYEVARAHDGIGQACHAAGDFSAARRHWEQALAGFAALSVPEARAVRECLARLSPA
jgi:tetratricopeptide (TPR) repeat protein